jgi:hypothetical protein
MNDDFYAGCTQANSKLSASDTLRKTEPGYKAGWNTWTPTYNAPGVAPAAPAAPAPSAAPAPQAHPGGDVDQLVASPPRETQPKADAEFAELPDRTPEGTRVEKKTFYSPCRAGLSICKDVNLLLRVADKAVAIAHLDALRCDSITHVASWMFSRGLTLECNEWAYKYYIEDKGRGWYARIAD